MGTDFWKRFSRNKIALGGSCVVIMLFILSVFAPWIAPYDPQEVNLKLVLSPPSASHLCGTDQLGRDVFSRMVWGSRISLKVGFVATGIAMLIGAVLGFLAGLTGIGGGVFLSPLLYVFRWVKPKTTGGIAAGFIVLNSIAGLVGTGWEKITHAGPLLWLTLPAVIGALLGTHFGARRWSSVTFSRVLAGVLIFAGGKLLIEAAT